MSSINSVHHGESDCETRNRECQEVNLNAGIKVKYTEYNYAYLHRVRNFNSPDVLFANVRIASFISSPFQRTRTFLALREYMGRMLSMPMQVSLLALNESDCSLSYLFDVAEE